MKPSETQVPDLQSTKKIAFEQEVLLTDLGDSAEMRTTNTVLLAK